MLIPFCTVQMTADRARKHLHAVDPEASHLLVDEVSVLVEQLFAGLHPDYQKADLKYHNLEHTLFATQCFIDLVQGWIQHRHVPVFGHREFSLGFAAIMLHDIGYLKARDDMTGTGAKYTSTHVVRSCAVAEILLPRIGCTPDEIEGITKAIRCTGLTSKIDQIVFRTEVERLTGCMVATADYLGQMADPHYPEKLPGLFAEFEESCDFTGVPADKRPFKSVNDLMAKTGGFWTHFALPKLEKEYESVYRSLALPDGSNPYVEAVDRNLTTIAGLVSA